jgi:hypothetical protein
MPPGAELSHFHYIQGGNGTHITSNSMATEGNSPWKKGWSMKLATYCHPVHRLWMRGSLLILPYTFMTWRLGKRTKFYSNQEDAIPKFCLSRNYILKLRTTALGYGLDDQGFESQHEVEIYLFTTETGPNLQPTQPPIQWVPGTLSLGIKWPGREADHSPPTSVEVKNTWSYTSTPPIRLQGVVLCLK